MRGMHYNVAREVEGRHRFPGAERSAVADGTFAQLALETMSERFEARPWFSTYGFPPQCLTYLGTRRAAQLTKILTQ